MREQPNIETAACVDPIDLGAASQVTLGEPKHGAFEALNGVDWREKTIGDD